MRIPLEYFVLFLLPSLGIRNFYEMRWRKLIATVTVHFLTGAFVQMKMKYYVHIHFNDDMLSHLNSMLSSY
jgi:hypothetical protein